MLNDLSLIHSGRRHVAEVQYVLPNLTAPVEQVAEALAQSVPRSPAGFAGFPTRGRLRAYLAHMLIDRGQKKPPALTIADTALATISSTISDSLRRCYRQLPSRFTRAFVFPTESDFVRRQMGGSTGFTPTAHTIILHIVPEYAGNRRRCLPSAVAHEYCHSVQLAYGRFNTVLEALVFEGMAEHFRDHVIGGPRSPWARALTQARNRKILSQLAPLLHSRDLALRRELFFGGRRFQRWTGYSVGYFLVSAFLRNRPSMPWSRITRMDARIVLRIAGVL